MKFETKEEIRALKEKAIAEKRSLQKSRQAETEELNADSKIWLKSEPKPEKP